MSRSRLPETHLLRRGHTFYYRARIPASALVRSLRSTHIVVSLKTRDLDRAARRARLMLVAMDRAIEEGGGLTSDEVRVRTRHHYDETHRAIDDLNLVARGSLVSTLLRAHLKRHGLSATSGDAVVLVQADRGLTLPDGLGTTLAALDQRFVDPVGRTVAAATALHARLVREAMGGPLRRATAETCGSRDAHDRGERPAAWLRRELPEAGVDLYELKLRGGLTPDPDPERGRDVRATGSFAPLGAARLRDRFLIESPSLVTTVVRRFEETVPLVSYRPS